MALLGIRHRAPQFRDAIAKQPAESAVEPQITSIGIHAPQATSAYMGAPMMAIGVRTIPNITPKKPAARFRMTNWATSPMSKNTAHRKPNVAFTKGLPFSRGTLLYGRMRGSERIGIGAMAVPSNFMSQTPVLLPHQSPHLRCFLPRCVIRAPHCLHESSIRSSTDGSAPDTLTSTAAPHDRSESATAVLPRM